MPTIEVSEKDLLGMIGKELSNEELDDALLYVKGEIDSRAGDVLKIEIADTNRPDLWSTEGIAREIRRQLGMKKQREIKFKPSGVKVIVDKNLKGIRPRTVCAVIKGLKITDDVIKQIIQMQEKICESYGAKRREIALGIYDLNKIKSPIYYKAYSPESLKFIPLEMDEEMDLNEILERHPKGKEYKHLLEGKEKYPIFIDSNDEVLSMPPVINSNHTGRVTEDTKDLFIECSGFEHERLSTALNVVVAALLDRDATIETVEIEYVDGKIITPDFTPKEMEMDPAYINKISGLELDKNKMKELLEKSGYHVEEKNRKFSISYPSYRNDIMHPVDVVEDVIISYGYNEIVPLSVDFRTTGMMTRQNRLSSLIANLMIGTGAQEIMNYTLTNRENLNAKMNHETDCVEIVNPASLNWSVFRTWLTPGLMESLSKNTSKEYPQQVYEIGETVVKDEKKDTKTSTVMRMAYSIAAKDVTFTNAKQVLDFLLGSLDVEYAIEETKHGSFIEGRCGRVLVNGKKIAYIGEIHPAVLENWNIKFPVASFEINITELIENIK